MTDWRGRIGDERPRPIECLLRGTVRVVARMSEAAAGACPRCGYPGWTYSDDLDSTTLRYDDRTA